MPVGYLSLIISKVENKQRRVSCVLVISRKMAAFGEKESVVSSGQCTVIVMINKSNLKFEWLLRAPRSPGLTPAIIFSFRTRKNGSMLKDLATMTRWSLRSMVILRYHKQGIEVIEQNVSS